MCFLRFLFIINLFFMFFTIELKSQDRILTKPAKYQWPCFPKDKYDYSPASDFERTPMLWVVFSDRDGNQTYTTPGGDKRFLTLKFCESFYVTDEKDYYVRIAKDPSPDPKTRKLSHLAEDYGWIHKEKLVLWNYCLVTEDKVRRKAMVINTIEHLKSRTGGDLNVLKFLDTPKIGAKETGKESRLFEFFFVVKKERDLKNKEIMVLLSTKELFQQWEISGAIIGWAPQSRLTLWDHRVAVEPNWYIEAVRERKNSLNSKFFKDEPAAISYQRGRKISDEDVIWDNDSYEKRRSGYWRRFPILETSKKNKDIFSVGVMGRIIPGEGVVDKIPERASYDPEAIAEIQKLITNMKEAKQNINIIFVIDGTKSMGPYFPATRNAISGCMKVLSKQEKSYRFGAIVYRDYPEGEGVLEASKLQGEVNEIIGFLNNIEAKDIFNKTHPESMYYGLIRALRTLNFNPEQTNILILVGDAGNHIPDLKGYTIQNVIKLLTEKHCHFLAFQVNHQSHSAYNDFVTQTKQIMEKNVDIHFQNYFQNLQNRVPNLDLKIDPPHSIPSQDPYTFEIVGGPFISKVFSLPVNKSLEPGRLTDQVEQYIKQLDIETDNIINILQNLQAGGGFPEIIVSRDNEAQADSSDIFTDRLAKGILAILQQYLTDEQIRIVLEKKVQLYHRASSTMHVKGQKFPLFKKVVLLSKRELGEMISYLQLLSQSSDAREDLQRAWKTILKNYSGGKSMRELENMPLNDLHEMVFGIPIQSMLLRGVRVQDITDENIFVDSDVMEYCQYIARKLPGLERIFNMSANLYPYAFETNGVYYYWIDEDLLP